MSMPVTARASSLTSPTLRTPLSPPAACRRRRPWRASSSRRRVRARASCARRAARATRAGMSSSDTLQFRRRRFSELNLRVERPCAPPCRSAPRCGGRRRRRRCRRRTGDQADVAGAADMGAAAELDRPAEAVAGRRSPIATTRTSSPYFSPNSARAPDARASSSAIRRVVDRRSSAARCRWRCPRPARSPRASSAWYARSRSAAGRARPASPSARRDRRAPGAAPRAADASPNGWRGSRARRA